VPFLQEPVTVSQYSTPLQNCPSVQILGAPAHTKLLHLSSTVHELPSLQVPDGFTGVNTHSYSLVDVETHVFFLQVVLPSLPQAATVAGLT
jgi:hypothetical protein